MKKERLSWTTFAMHTWGEVTAMPLPRCSGREHTTRHAPVLDIASKISSVFFPTIPCGAPAFFMQTPNESFDVTVPSIEIVSITISVFFFLFHRYRTYRPRFSFDIQHYTDTHASAPEPERRGSNTTDDFSTRSPPPTHKKRAGDKGKDPRQ